MTRFNAQGLRRQRTDEERERRHLHGENGAKFNAKYAYPGNDGTCSCVTTFTNKDNLIVEYEET